MHPSALASWSRRRFGYGAARLATALLALEADRPAHITASKKQKKRKKPPLNAYGCLNVGQRCRGNSDRCCSGICDGKKPKRGKRDRSRCVAHDIGPCTAEDDKCINPPGPTCNPAKPFSQCYRTTGAASFCGDSSVGGCIDCRKDADCVEFGFGERSACVVCESCPGDVATSCISAAV